MKKIITLLLAGIAFLPVKLFSKDYDTITRKDGNHFEMLWISGIDTIFGKYTVPEELSEKEATDIILGKVKNLEKKDQYSLKIYSISASCDAILVKETLYGIDPNPFLKPFIAFFLLFAPFVILLIPLGFYWYKNQKKISIREISTR